MLFGARAKAVLRNSLSKQKGELVKKVLIIKTKGGKKEKETGWWCRGLRKELEGLQYANTAIQKRRKN